MRQRKRNAQPRRRMLYDAAWVKESRGVRDRVGVCQVSGCSKRDELTVDHPTRAVLCRTHHGELEAARRRSKKFNDAGAVYPAKSLRTLTTNE